MDVTSIKRIEDDTKDQSVRTVYYYLSYKYIISKTNREYNEK